MNTTDISLIISKYSFWVAIVVCFIYIGYQLTILFQKNRKKIQKVINKYKPIKKEDCEETKKDLGMEIKEGETRGQD